MIDMIAIHGEFAFFYGKNFSAEYKLDNTMRKVLSDLSCMCKTQIVLHNIVHAIYIFPQEPTKTRLPFGCLLNRKV